MHPAFKKMIDFNRANPDAKDVYKKMQAWVIKNPQAGVFCPAQQIFAMSAKMAQLVIMGSKNKNNPLDLEAIRYFYGLHLFGTWRNTLSIYVLNSDIAESVLQSPIPNDTPVSIFTHLPEWCVYLELPKGLMTLKSGDATAKLLGFWALFDVQKGKKVLNLVPNLDDGLDISYTQLHPISIVIDDGLTVEQAVRKMYRTTIGDGIATNIFMQTDYKMATSLLSALLWLCVEEPDISGVVGEPISRSELSKPKHTQHPKTGAFIVPSEPTIYKIGERLGGEMRTLNQQITKSDKTHRPSRKRPHIRRGHWHGYWHGTGQAKEFKVKWLSAVFVNS